MKRLVALLATSAAFAMATAGLAVTAPSGIDSRLRLDWEATDSRAGRPVISGYIYNDYGRAAINVRLLAETLDAGEQVVDRTIAFVPGNVPGSSRSYFIIPLKRAGAGYRVVVTSFDWKESSF